VTPPFFYRWIIVAISMLAGFFSAGVSNITMAWGSARLIAGISFDLIGNYQTIFAIFLANYLLSAVMIFLVRPPGAKRLFGLGDETFPI
jgi:hypothetical protein